MTIEPVLTANQKPVFGTWQRAVAALNAYAVFQRLRGQGVRVSLWVYGGLEKFIDHGLVRRLKSLNAFLVFDRHGGHAQHPVTFAICHAWGIVGELSNPSVEKGLVRWSTGHAFRAKRVTVELRGLCESCDGAVQ